MGQSWLKARGEGEGDDVVKDKTTPAYYSVHLDKIVKELALCLSFVCVCPVRIFLYQVEPNFVWARFCF